jgi:hypothetical protein
MGLFLLSSDDTYLAYLSVAAPQASAGGSERQVLLAGLFWRIVGLFWRVRGLFFNPFLHTAASRRKLALVDQNANVVVYDMHTQVLALVCYCGGLYKGYMTWTHRCMHMYCLRRGGWVYKGCMKMHEYVRYMDDKVYKDEYIRYIRMSI